MPQCHFQTLQFKPPFSNRCHAFAIEVFYCFDVARQEQTSHFVGQRSWCAMACGDFHSVFQLHIRCGGMLRAWMHTLRWVALLLSFFSLFFRFRYWFDLMVTWQRTVEWSVRQWRNSQKQHEETNAGFSVGYGGERRTNNNQVNFGLSIRLSQQLKVAKMRTFCATGIEYWLVEWTSTVESVQSIIQPPSIVSKVVDSWTLQSDFFFQAWTKSSANKKEFDGVSTNVQFFAKFAWS